MSLQVLLRCSDEEFERLISLMDIQGVLDIISELQNEMDKEQEKFDRLSASLAFVPDQSSAHFKKLSVDLVKSQNMLALLVARNMHCFKVSIEPDDDEEPTEYSDIYSEREDNSYSSREITNKTEDVRREISKLKRVGRTTQKEISSSVKSVGSNNNNSTIPYAVNNIPCLSTTSIPHSPDMSRENPRQQSTATLTVTSPRNTPQDMKPKRVLKVRTATLACGKSRTLNPPTNKSNMSPNKELSNEDEQAIKRDLSNSVSTTHRTADNSSPQRTKADTIRCNESTLLISPTRSPSSVSKSSQCAVSPCSTANVTLSPRSDISNLATPGSLVSTPRLPVSTILDLDIPETRLDGESNLKHSPPRDCEGGSDKTSYTTDESGFTSASSDSDSTLLAPDIVYDYLSEEDEKIEERISTRNWNPSKLLEELYTLQLAKEFPAHQDDIINIEGYLERMPLGKNKNTLLKTWKRTYCKTIDGTMYFYDRKGSAEARSYMSLMGGKVEEMSNRMLGIDDMRGHYLMVRCSSDGDYLNWKKSFYTQIKCSPHTNYVRPCLTSTPSSNSPRVIIIDLGSTNIRAGLLGSLACYPQLFFPAISSTNAEGQVVFGREAYKPENRVRGLHRPIASCREVDTYRINLQVLPELFIKIFTELKVDDAENYVALLATPHNFSARLKEEVLNILLGQHKMAAVNVVNQSLLTPYIYNATSGIVVDIGERIEIVSIMDGYLVDGGLNRQSFGGSRITDNLNSYLADYRLLTPVEYLFPRLVKEKTCFVSKDYGDDLLKYLCNETECTTTVDLKQYNLPLDFHLKHIAVDTARFKAAEGIMKAELLGVDSPTLPKLIDRAIQRCPLDVRREMWQSIYLSGGTTLMDGFADRLQIELGKLAPSSLPVQVVNGAAHCTRGCISLHSSTEALASHNTSIRRSPWQRVHASPHRYHAAYIGACMLAKLPTFLSSCITREEWTSSGLTSLNKWKMYFQG